MLEKEGTIRLSDQHDDCFPVLLPREEPSGRLFGVGGTLPRPDSEVNAPELTRWPHDPGSFPQTLGIPPLVLSPWPGRGFDEIPAYRGNRPGEQTIFTLAVSCPG